MFDWCEFAPPPTTAAGRVRLTASSRHSSQAFAPPSPAGFFLAPGLSAGGRMYVFSETEKWCLSRFGQSRLISSDAIAGDNNDLRRFTFRLGKDQGAWTSRHHRGSETP